jgi:hypothetical protein
VQRAAVAPSTRIARLSAVVAVVYAVLLAFLILSGAATQIGAYLIAPLLFLITLPALSRQAAREQDHSLFRLLVLALVVKLVGGIVRHSVTYDIYGHSDAGRYDVIGAQIASNFTHGDFHTGLHGLTGTNFISFLAGLIYTAIGHSLLAAYVVFSWLGFWGLFYFYRAFQIAVPEGRARTYAKFLFFLPALVFWDSSIGKEAWMVFALGIAAYGAARMLSSKGFLRGLLVTALGITLASFARVHVAMLMGVALAVAMLMKRPSRRMRELGIGPLAKVVSLVPVIVIAVILVHKTNAFLQSAHLGSSVTSVSSGVTGMTKAGHSSFSALSITQDPLHAPLAILTVMFRPFPWEVHSSQELLASLERTFIFALFLLRARWIWAAIRSVRRQPYVLLALVYTALFIVGFSSVGNFGILNRQSVQMIPLVLVLVCIPPRPKRRKNGHAEPPSSIPETTTPAPATG